MSGSVILSGARTPIGKLGGALASLAPVELGSLSIAEALRRAAVQASAVDYVLMGQVLQAGQGQNPARQAAVAAGIPMSVPAMTINKVCLSSLQALHLADLMIGAGEAEVVVVGGMESMSKAPYLVDGARAGLVYGDAALRDVIATDGLTCAFDHLAMGCATERDTADAGDRARGPGCRRRPFPRQGGGGNQERPVCRGNLLCCGPDAPGRPDPGHRRRGHPAGHYARAAGQAPPGFLRHWYDHRWQREPESQTGRWPS